MSFMHLLPHVSLIPLPSVRNNGFSETCPLTEINVMLLRGGGRRAQFSRRERFR